MSLLSALSLVCGLMLHVSFSVLNPHYCVPRKTVPYQSKSHLLSSMLLQTLTVLQHIYSRLDQSTLAVLSNALIVTDGNEGASPLVPKAFLKPHRNAAKWLHTLHPAFKIFCRLRNLPHL